jgi:hypothetical protein
VSTQAQFTTHDYCEVRRRPAPAAKAFTPLAPVLFFATWLILPLVIVIGIVFEALHVAHLIAHLLTHVIGLGKVR